MDYREKTMTIDKIKGMFLGAFIGDALGLPVESWSKEKIKDKFGRIDKYHAAVDHKYMKEHCAGTWSDDSQLTIAVAKGLMDRPLDMNRQALRHVEAYKQTTAGWGTSTKESVRKLANGVNWNKSSQGVTGKGNGLPMKISAVGALASTNNFAISKVDNFVIDLSLMTHPTSISASAGLAQCYAITYCLEHEAGDFDHGEFVQEIVQSSKVGRKVLPETIGEDDLTKRLALLEFGDYSEDKAIKDFGGGSAYVYNSLPFTYVFFLKNYLTIESLYDVISAGGDTDSNGSMLGALMGALHGTSIFPKSLIDGLNQDQLSIINGVSDKFIMKFFGS